MYKILDHEADTTIRFFYNDFEELVISIIKSFQETILGRSENLEWSNVEPFNSAVEAGISYKFFAIDLLNEMIFLMEEKDLLPVELRKIDLNDNVRELQIDYGKCLNVTNYNAIPKAATTNSGQISDKFFDITLDL